MRAALARCNYAHTSFCFFGTSKLVSSQFSLFTLFFFREKNGEKNLAINLNKFCLHAVADLRLIARIAMARCTREAKFEVVQRHYIQIYPANFLLLHKIYPPLT